VEARKLPFLQIAKIFLGEFDLTLIYCVQYAHVRFVLIPSSSGTALWKIRWAGDRRCWRALWRQI